MVDGYYGYNFNDPYDRVNLLRAYDVLSNSFSLNQADVVFERAPDVDCRPALGRAARLAVWTSHGDTARQSSQ